MDDDLNTSKALAVLFDLANKVNKDANNQNLTLLNSLSSGLGFNFDKIEISQEELQEKINLIADKLGIEC